MKYICYDDQLSVFFGVDSELFLNLNLLKNYMIPYFDISYSTGIDKYDFFIKPFNAMSLEHVTTKQKITLHLDRSAYVIKVANDSGIYYIYSNYRIGYYVSPNKIIMYSDLSDEIDYYDLVRVIMAIYNIKMIVDGYVRVHMALAKVDGKTFALVGDKEKGKTTFLLNMLNIGEKNCFMGANDKCYLKINRNLQVYAKGSFEYMGIRHITSKSFNGLLKMSQFRNTDMLFFWPGEVLEYFHADAMGKDRVDYWVLPDINIAQESLHSRTEFLEKSYINDVLFNFSDANHMQWLVDQYLSYHNKFTIQYSQNKETLLNKLSAIKYWRITGNPYNTEDLYDTLMTIL